MSDWLHQIKAHNELLSLMEAGEKAICVTSPTGGGKTRMQQNLVRWCVDHDIRCGLYTNRKLLTEQTSRVLASSGVDHRVMANGWDADLLHAVQVASMQTVQSRVYRTGSWMLPPWKVVLIDEAHSQADGECERVLRDHMEHGATIVGYTATPIDLGHLYTKLIVAGTNTELRACGALVPAVTYAPDEPDAAKLKRTKTGEYTEGDVVKAIMSPTIFGRVLEHWKRLNPDGRSTILFGPGVAESLWFAQQFEKIGIRAAHIDGKDVYIDGQSQPTEKDIRQYVLDESRANRCPVICNRFVLREGIDAPWLEHCILATIFGSIQSYLQAGGRILRSYPGVEKVIVQDHGGAWHRHGSLNVDREWHLEWTNNIYAGLREMAFRERKKHEPIVCPSCHAVRNGGDTCPQCGHRADKKSRMVVQKNGQLKPVFGDIYKPRRVRAWPGIEQEWARMYYRGLSRCKKGDKPSFVSLEALFAMEHNWSYPPRTLPLMPTRDVDWYRSVDSVPRANLRSA